MTQHAEITCNTCKETFTGKDHTDAGFQFLLHTCDLDYDLEEEN